MARRNGVTTRGTSNKNESGSAEDRRRKRWLLLAWRADVDAPLDPAHRAALLPVDGVPLGTGERACRCYRCGALLTFSRLTVDRVVPGCQGGTYRRDNIRPACGDCNSRTGARLQTQHRTRTHADGWSCTCGAGRVGAGFTEGRARAAAGAHQRAEEKKRG